MRLDISIAAYLCFFPFLIYFLSILFPKRIAEKIIYYYTWVLIGVFALLSIIDLEIYQNWGYRLDATAFVYMESPDEVWASIGASPLLLLTIMLVIIVVIEGYAFRRFVYKRLQTTPKPSYLEYTLVLLFTVALIIPARGGLQQIPINQSSAYFSAFNYANHVAVNSIWNLGDSIQHLIDGSSTDKNPYLFYSDQEAKKTVSNYLPKPVTKSKKLLKTNRPNIVLVMWESLTAKVVAPLGGVEGVTPNFEKYCNEGILFTRCYAAGSRSEKGIVGILSGYPAQPVPSIIREPEKTEKLPSLSEELAKAGYKNNFFYGGELQFANMKSYLLNIGFDHLVDENDFPSSALNSKWGAHDHIVYDKFLTGLNHSETPFFSTIFTLSSHEPFEIPTAAQFPGDDRKSQFFSSLYYADSCFNVFMEAAKKSNWWDNTLIIVIADHGHSYPGKAKIHEENKYHIPMLWLGGALNKKDIKFDKVCSQMDLVSTLLGQMDINHDDFAFSHDLFGDDYLPHAFYIFNNGVAFIQPDRFLSYDHISSSIVEQKGAITDEDLKTAKAYLQYTYQDFLNK